MMAWLLSPLSVYYHLCRTLELTITFYPLSLLKFQMYASVTTKNQWTEMLSAGEESDEEQDTLKV